MVLVESKEGPEVDKGLKGKIVEKLIYERNKHIFPYKNWKYVRRTISA